MGLLSITWDVSPSIFKLGFFELRWYSLGFLIAFVLGQYLMTKFFVEDGKEEKLSASLLNYMFFGVIVGARLGHCFFYDWAYFSQNPLEILYIWQGGLASHGGTLGILLVIFLFCRKYKLQYFYVFDRLIIPICLGAFFIRVGNFFNSEIVGIPTQLPWGVIFELNPRVSSVPRHPAQLYEAFSYLGVFVLLYFLYKKTQLRERYQGAIFAIGLIGIFVMRFIIEFIKIRQADFVSQWSLSLGQWLSLPIIVAGITILFWSLKKKESI